MTKPWAIAIHGGAGTIKRDPTSDRNIGIKRALDELLVQASEWVLSCNSAIDVVTEVVAALESLDVFNAGRGAVLNHAGEHELDAALMCGRELNAGAVSQLKSVKHPIRLAREVMLCSPHVFLSGAGAEDFADETSLERVANEYFTTDFRKKQYEYFKSVKGQSLRDAERTSGLSPRIDLEPVGTVGAVCCDVYGNLAAATSTGGTPGKKHGRIGDTPIIGAGTYAANDTCAVSGTGIGEIFILHSAAAQLSQRMRFLGESLAQAAHALVFETLPQGSGGVIAVDRFGNFTMPYNSLGMYRAGANFRGRHEVAIWE